MKQLLDVLTMIVVIILIMVILIDIANEVYILSGGPCTSNALCAP